MTTPKVTVIGTGNIGSATATRIVEAGFASVCLYDYFFGVAMGKSLDISQGIMSNMCSATENLAEAVVDAEVIVFSAGLPRKSGQSRNDLFVDNAKLLIAVGEVIQKVNPNAFVLIVTNPVDALTTVFNRTFPQLKGVGFGCSLDTQRFRHFVSQQLQISPSLVHGFIGGAHNHDMFLLSSTLQVDGKAIANVLSEEQLATLLADTRDAGATIVNHLKTTGSFIAASYIIFEIVDAVINNRPKNFSLNVMSNGEYGVVDCAPALPVRVDKELSFSRIPLRLTEKETESLQKAASGIIKTVGAASIELTSSNNVA